VKERRFVSEKRKRGRPKLPAELRRCRRSYVYVSEHELAQMRDRASADGCSVMALVRRSLCDRMGWKK